MTRETINLPDFIIIGANKAATTSLSYYLSCHPEVYMSRVKEPMFFTTHPSDSATEIHEADLEKPFFTSTLPEYSSMFDDAPGTAKSFGEASTAYLANPHIAARAIKKIVPNVKLIAVLREPVQRAISAYKMYCGNGFEDRSFSEIVDGARNQLTINGAQGGKDYIRNGLYSQLLEPFTKLFPPSQLLILKYDDLESKGTEFMASVCKYLELSPLEFDLNVKLNTSHDAYKDSVLIDDEDVQRLRACYLDEILKLQNQVNIDISDWIQSGLDAKKALSL